MKKLIYVTLVVLGVGTLSSFTLKKDSAATKHDTVAGKTQLGTADEKGMLGTADEKGMLGTADAKKAKVAHDQTQLGTAD
jgi:hypothetical protein